MVCHITHLISFSERLFKPHAKFERWEKAALVEMQEIDALADVVLLQGLKSQKILCFFFYFFSFLAPLLDPSVMARSRSTHQIFSIDDAEPLVLHVVCVKPRAE